MFRNLSPQVTKFFGVKNGKKSTMVYDLFHEKRNREERGADEQTYYMYTGKYQIQQTDRVVSV